jgi:hypothetical protein
MAECFYPSCKHTIMKHFITCTALTLAALSAAAKEKKAPDVMGSWKETSRMGRDKATIAFTDTMYTDFLIGNEYTTGRKTGFLYKGTYKVTAGTLDLGMRMYNITESAPKRLVLQDDGGYYVWERYEKPDPRVENSSAAASGSRGHRESDFTDQRVSLSQLKGKWEVFKRTSSETMPEINYKKLLHTLDIKGAGISDSSGIYAAADPNRIPGWYVTRYDNNTIYCSGPSGSRELKVLKCVDGELIVQEGIVTYFFKQFRN